MTQNEITFYVAIIFVVMSVLNYFEPTIGTGFLFTIAFLLMLGDKKDD